MLASIHPLGERARNNRWWLTVSAYAAASAAGGAAVGTTAGAAGWALSRGWAEPEAVTAAVVGLAAVTAAGWDLSARGRSLPPRRQVNEDWLSTYRGWVYGAGFGLQLGAGLVTIVTTATVPLTFVLALLSAAPGRGAVIGASFGAARAVPALLLRRVHTAEGLRAFHVRMQAAQHRARLAAGVTAAATAVAAAALVVTGAAAL